MVAVAVKLLLPHTTDRSEWPSEERLLEKGQEHLRRWAEDQSKLLSDCSLSINQLHGYAIVMADYEAV